MTTTYRLGADIGGTFTDVVLRGDDESIHQCKVSSTPEDYSLGILSGAQDLLARVAAAPGQVAEIIHATTVATNTVLEGKGAKTALVTTRGFRDVVEIGRLRVPRRLAPPWMIDERGELRHGLDRDYELRGRLRSGVTDSDLQRALRDELPSVE